MNYDGQFLWSERYRPKTIEDTILPQTIKTIFQKFVEHRQIPNLLLTGSSGVGKTTVARAMLDELDSDYILINASKDGNIDTLRTVIQDFASTMSFKGGRKYVILDEADYLNPTSTQPALRGFMDEFAVNCGFIFTCNYDNRIITPLKSRASTVEFRIDKADVPGLMLQFYKRLTHILNAEGIPYQKEVLKSYVPRYFPDFRKAINYLQHYAASGEIDSGILANTRESRMQDLVRLMKSKDYTGARKWVAENIDTDVTSIFRDLYDQVAKFIPPSHIPLAVVLTNKYQFQAAFVADQEVNLSAFIAELMIECKFND